ncbi:MAG: Ig-like domain-containing protein [Anaerolineaceae bacterium]
MKKNSVAILIAILVSLVIISAASAQGEELTLGLSRDFGSGGFNSDIQGTFTVKASGPANLERVQFFLDEALLGEDTESPFAIQFVTDNYPTGAHVFTAVGFTTDGMRIGSKTISAVFMSKEEASAVSLKTAVPILAIAFGAIAISAITTMVNVRKGKKLTAGAARSYSFGGGICPRCKRPFGFQLLGIHMFGRKLTPCPYCGKWSVMKQATMSELHAAELAELDTEKAQIHDASDEEKIRKGLDDSKYQNL